MIIITYPLEMSPLVSVTLSLFILTSFFTTVNIKTVLQGPFSRQFLTAVENWQNYIEYFKR